MTDETPSPARAVARLAWREGVLSTGERVIPEETAVSLVYDGGSHAVMMASPADLEDFALGFSITAGIVSSPDEIEAIDVEELESGIDIQIRLKDKANTRFEARRRRLAGPVGCGLCGIESIEQAVRPVPDVSASPLALSHSDIVRAVSLLNEAQPLHRETRAVHGAGFYLPGEGLLAVREDVGRHNALDKLCGAVIRSGRNGAGGAVVVTSRISVEMVQKTAILGASILIAISAPTALAIRTAEEAGMTLVALVRGEDFEIFTHPDRISPESIADVA